MLRNIQIVPTKLVNPLKALDNEKMDEENKEEEESEYEVPTPTNIDSPIYVPQIDKVIIVDLMNGLFVAELTPNGSGTLRPYFELDVTS